MGFRDLGSRVMRTGFHWFFLLVSMGLPRLILKVYGSWFHGFWGLVIWVFESRFHGFSGLGSMGLWDWFMRMVHLTDFLRPV